MSENKEKSIKLFNKHFKASMKDYLNKMYLESSLDVLRPQIEVVKDALYEGFNIANESQKLVSMIESEADRQHIKSSISRDRFRKLLHISVEHLMQ